MRGAVQRHLRGAFVHERVVDASLVALVAEPGAGEHPDLLHLVPEPVVEDRERAPGPCLASGGHGPTVQRRRSGAGHQSALAGRNAGLRRCLPRSLSGAAARPLEGAPAPELSVALDEIAGGLGGDAGDDVAHLNARAEQLVLDAQTSIRE